MSSVEEMLKKAVTTSDSFYKDRNAVQGYRDKKDAIRAQRKEKKNTLSQWYGLRKATLSEDDKKELELLQYRNFVDPDSAFQAPKRTDGAASEYVEFGFVAGTGRNKRKRLRSFADEWIEENPQFEEVVAQRMKRNVRFNKKAKALAAKKAAAAAAKEKARHHSKRKKMDDRL